MKTEKNTKMILTSTLTVLALLLGACSAATSAAPAAEVPQPEAVSAQTDEAAPILAAPAENLTTVADDGATDITPNSVQANLTATGTLSEDEINGLVFMREEEKLAHDVYIALYEIWGINIFQNIASSEQTHTDTVKVVLDAYGIADPAANTAPGVFVDPALQDLYTQLVAQGSQSLADALKVGAAIEEIDILDLEERIAQTENAGIITVYENLMKGSRNHLRSFVSTIAQQTGETYVPQYLSTDVYDSIVGSSIESGGNGNSGGRGKGSGNRP